MQSVQNKSNSTLKVNLNHFYFKDLITLGSLEYNKVV